jgi:hypothetical protein
MAKKTSFDSLPERGEEILERLMSGKTGHAASPDDDRRLAIIEKRVENIERLLSSDRPTMDKHEVLRALKIKPAMLARMEAAGELISHKEGRKTVFYEDDVVKTFMRSTWKKVREPESEPEPKPARAKRASVEPAPMDIPAEGHHRVGIREAVVILDRKAGAIRQHMTSGLPYHKDGRRVYFYTDELREWSKTHPPLKRKPK